VHPDVKLEWTTKHKASPGDGLKDKLLADDSAMHNVRVFVLLRLRIASEQEIEAVTSASELFGVIVDHVLARPFSRRLVLQAALCLVVAHAHLVSKISDTERERLLDAVADLAEVSVFYEVRQEAAVVLQTFADVRTKIMELFRMPERLDKLALKEFLVDKYPGLRPTEADDSGVFYIFKRNYGSNFAHYIRACRDIKGGLHKFAPESQGEYPCIVALYYLLLQVEDIPGEVISELLASRRFLERKMALVHVGAAQRSAFRNQVVHIKSNDPIKDVRLGAEQALELLTAPVEALDSIERTLQLYTELLDRERLNLVLDLEFITRCQEEAEAMVMLRTFDESLRSDSTADGSTAQWS
jgi:hypothetical protein